TERLRVVLENKQLEDDKTFAFYNIEHLSVLTFVMRMPGGKGMHVVSIVNIIL
ncbi:hypothetical protein ABG768_017696, partial [Culter alburnus]